MWLVSAWWFKRMFPPIQWYPLVNDVLWWMPFGDKWNDQWLSVSSLPLFNFICMYLLEARNITSLCDPWFTNKRMKIQNIFGLRIPETPAWNWSSACLRLPVMSTHTSSLWITWPIYRCITWYKKVIFQCKLWHHGKEWRWFILRLNDLHTKTTYRIYARSLCWELGLSKCTQLAVLGRCRERM